MLNEYFSYMVNAIFAEEGILDKYIGTCILRFPSCMLLRPFPQVMLAWLYVLQCEAAPLVLS